jgi:hypothetical protein
LLVGFGKTLNDIDIKEAAKAGLVSRPLTGTHLKRTSNSIIPTQFGTVFLESFAQFQAKDTSESICQGEIGNFVTRSKFGRATCISQTQQT